VRAKKRAAARGARYHLGVDAWLRLIAVIALGAGSVSCAHAVTIESAPVGAIITVDGEEVGPGPVRIERVVYMGDQLRISAEKEGFERMAVSIPASEWYPWPAVLAFVPLLGLPLAVPALLIPVAGLVIAPVVAVGWAVATSPLLLSLALTRKFPETVTVTLKKRRNEALETLTPGDLFGYPDEAGPNPLPDVGPRTTSMPSSTPPLTPPQTQPGANPVP
jgi:hypothetical protein